MGTQQILIRSQIRNRVLREGLTLNNRCSDRLVTQSGLKYLMGVKVVRLKCWDIGGKTGPIPTVRVCLVVKPIATVQGQVEPNL